MAKRTTKELVRIIADRLGWGKLTGNSCLTDFDPLVTVMCLVGNEIGEANLGKPKGRRVWLETMRDLQDDNSSVENNPFLPCRTCDQAFEPIFDETMLNLFLAWYRMRSVQALVAIHKCPACGGTVKAKRTKTYKGDMHTPEPGYAESDEHWAELLLEYCDA